MRCILFVCLVLVLTKFCLTKFKWKVTEGVAWEIGCDFRGSKRLQEIPCVDEFCGPYCRFEPKCTHFTWKAKKGGTCVMYTGTITMPYYPYARNLVLGRGKKYQCGFIFSR